MSYIGDFALGSTFDTKFTTVSTTGAPTTIAGTWAISIYVNNDVVQLGPATVATPAAGITITLDFDGITGMHNVNVVATSGNGYATGKNYQIMVSTGTVGGTSIVGYVVAEFSIEARSALRPTVAGKTLDVTTGGTAGIDWANVEAPTTALNLSATNIDVDQVVASVSGAVNSVATGVTVTTNNDKTGYTASTVSDKTGYALAAGGVIATAIAAAELNTIADAVLDRNMATGTDSGTDSTAVRTPRQAMRVLRNKATVAAGTLTVTKENDTTASFTAAVTTTAGNPISEVDPT